MTTKRPAGWHWLASAGITGASESKKLRDMAQAAVAAGYGMLELACHPVNGLSADDTANALLDAGLKIVSHCRFYPGDGSFGDPLGVSGSFDLAVETMDKDFAFIDALRGKGITVQYITGPSCFLLGHQYDLSPTDRRERIVRFFDEIGDDLISHQLTLALEYLQPDEDKGVIGGIDEMIHLLDRIGNSNIAWHGDVYHMLRCSEDPGATIRKGGKRLKYLHAHGTGRRAPGSPGDDVNWTDVAAALEEAGFDGPVVPEPFGDEILNQIPELAAGVVRVTDATEYYTTAKANLTKFGIL